MNRISRLLHKINFLSRQRHALDYSHKYVITNRDLSRATAVAAADKFASFERRRKRQALLVRPAVDVQAQKDQVLRDFDPAMNENDRRILFEVTGMRLDKDDFRDGESSNETDSDSDEASNPLAELGMDTTLQSDLLEHRDNNSVGESPYDDPSSINA